MMMMEEAPQQSVDQNKLQAMVGKKTMKNRIALKQAILYGIDVSSHAKH
jgi:hypothetical protein